MLHGTSHWKATIHTYSLPKFQIHHKLNAFKVACLNQQKAILASIDV
jgi:hypothetical protein